jgi:predicted secreted protein
MKKLLVLAFLTPAFGWAQTLTLDADARTKVANDEMVVTLSVEREGADSAALSDSVLGTLNGATKTAKALPQVQVRMGNVYTQPRWQDNKKVGWVMRGELQLTSQDLKALSGLTSELSQRLQIVNVTFRLSDELRRQEEAKLLKSAAQAFKDKAATAAQAFGYSQYVLGEMALNQSGSGSLPRPMPMMMTMKADRANMPVEGGDTEVSVSVTGKVQLVGQSQ